MKKYLLSLILVAIILVLFIIRGGIIGLITFTSIDSCQDSDLGKNFNIKGKVSGSYYLPFSLEPKTFLETDLCENENTLVEYYCIEDKINFRKESKKYRCSEGCMEGICKGVASEISFNFFVIVPLMIIILILISFVLLKNKNFTVSKRKKQHLKTRKE